jgi:hypothetical protein
MDKALYVYKMTADNGGAPCVSEGLLSLAICKPAIRMTAVKGSIIFGFGGKAYSERLLYIAEVTATAPEGKYYFSSRNSKRPDCIYRKNANGRAIIKKGAKYHSGGHQLKRDVGENFERATVLISNNFRYFGAEGSTDYKKFGSIKRVVEELKQGHRLNHSAKLYDQLTLLKTEVWRYTK